IWFNDGYTQKIGQVGPVQPSYVCLQTNQGLVALDPLKGTVLWSKTDVPMRTQIFGDDRHVYLIEVRDNGKASEGRALRAHDGVAVPVADFSEVFPNRVRTLGRNLLLREVDKTDGKTVFRLYDVHTGKDLWKKTFTANALRLESED